MFTDPVQFYFIKTGAHGPLVLDLSKITDQLGTYAGDGIYLKREADSLTISYDNTPIISVLQIGNEPHHQDKVISSQMVLTCERTDNTSVNLLRNIIKNMGYRVFNPEIGAYNSSDPDLLDLTTITIDKKVKNIINQNGFKPIFNYRNNLVYFAQPKNSLQIYQINSDLLLHLIESMSTNTQAGVKYNKKDFAVKVAEDLGHFIALYDRGMIQGSFYSKFNKLVNYSDFDIDKLKRDIYVRAIFFQYNQEKQKFDQFRGHQMKRDFVKQGESLYDFPKKVLKSLNIQNDFLVAKIQRKIDFEESDDTKLIPRLNMIIFVDE